MWDELHRESAIVEEVFTFVGVRQRQDGGPDGRLAPVSSLCPGLCFPYVTSATSSARSAHLAESSGIPSPSRYLHYK